MEFSDRQKILFIAVSSLAIHIVAIIFLTHLGDSEYWPRIMGSVNSGNDIYGLDGNYYTPIWGYLLSSLDIIIQGIGNIPLFENMFDVFLPWNDVPGLKPFITTPGINFVTKFPLAVCDIIVGYMIYKIVAEFTDSRKGIIAMVLWCFCPMVIYMSSVQGQFDTISTLLALLTIKLLREDHAFFAGVSFGLSVWLKLFPSVCILLFVGYLLMKHGKGVAYKHIALAAAGALLISVVIFLPQATHGELNYAFGFLTSRLHSSSYPDWFAPINTIRTVLMGLLTVALMIWSFIGIRNKRDERYLYLYAGVLIAVATIISRGYQYVPSFIPFILLFYMISYDNRSYKGLFIWISVLTVIDAFFSVGTSVFSITSVYYGLIDPAFLEEITVAFLTSIGHPSATPIGVVFAVIWAIMLWLFVLFGFVDLSDNRYPRIAKISEKLRFGRSEQ